MAPATLDSDDKTDATVAWSGNLRPTIRSDVSLKTFVGRGSAESIQTELLGDGFVVISPYEKAVLQAD